MKEESNITVISLPNNETLSSLKDYNVFLKSIFKRNLMSFTTIGHHSSLFCANSIENINMIDEICMLINSVIVKLPCFSIYSGIVTSNLLIYLWSDFNYSVNTILSELIEFRKILDGSFESMRIESKAVDVEFLQSQVESVLMDEPSIWLDKEAVHNLSFQIVKAVLSVTKSDHGLTLGHVGVHAEQGKDNFFIVDGVLCEVDDFNAKLIESDSPSFLKFNKLVLFGENLDDKEICLSIINYLFEKDVRVFVCQKQISNLLKVTLRRKRIITIERIGEDVAGNLQHLTGAISIRDLNKVRPEDLIPQLGHFRNIKLISSNKRNIISIEKEESSVVSLFIECRSFSDISIVKKSVNKSVNKVWSSLSNPFYLPGPVFFEESLELILMSSLKSNTLLNSIIKSFIGVLREVSVMYKESHLPVTIVNDSYSLKRNALISSIDTVLNVINVSHIVRKV